MGRCGGRCWHETGGMTEPCASSGLWYRDPIGRREVRRDRAGRSKVSEDHGGSGQQDGSGPARVVAARGRRRHRLALLALARRSPIADRLLTSDVALGAAEPNQEIITLLFRESTDLEGVVIERLDARAGGEPGDPSAQPDACWSVRHASRANEAACPWGRASVSIWATPRTHTRVKRVFAACSWPAAAIAVRPGCRVRARFCAYVNVCARRLIADGVYRTPTKCPSTCAYSERRMGPRSSTCRPLARESIPVNTACAGRAIATTGQSSEKRRCSARHA